MGWGRLNGPPRYSGGQETDHTGAPTWRLAGKPCTSPVCVLYSAFSILHSLGCWRRPPDRHGISPRRGRQTEAGRQRCPAKHEAIWFDDALESVPRGGIMGDTPDTGHAFLLFLRKAAGIV
jgi:hypothetical protein